MREKEQKVIARNKKVNHDYFILEKYECGIVLTGTEIKSVRLNKISIQDAYCDIIKGELFVVNMHIAKYEQGNIFNHQELRNRKLLVHKKEITRMATKVSLEGLTLIPIDVFIKNGIAKVTIGLCKGKKQYDKRNDLKEKSLKKDIEVSMKRR